MCQGACSSLLLGLPIQNAAFCRKTLVMLSQIRQKPLSAFPTCESLMSRSQATHAAGRRVWPPSSLRTTAEGNVVAPTETIPNIFPHVGLQEHQGARHQWALSHRPTTSQIIWAGAAIHRSTQVRSRGIQGKIQETRQSYSPPAWRHPTQGNVPSRNTNPAAQKHQNSCCFWSAMPMQLLSTGLQQDLHSLCQLRLDSRAAALARSRLCQNTSRFDEHCVSTLCASQRIARCLCVLASSN